MGNTLSLKDPKKKCFDIIANGDIKKLEKIIRKHPDYCDLRSGSHGDGMSLLILASFLDHPEKVDLLLKKGAHPDQPCGVRMRRSVDYYFSFRDFFFMHPRLREPTLTFLPLFFAQYGVTALHLSCLHGHTVVVRSLLKSGALPTTCDMVSVIATTVPPDTSALHLTLGKSGLMRYFSENRRTSSLFRISVRTKQPSLRSCLREDQSMPNNATSHRH